MCKGSTVIEIKNVTKDYKGVKALKDINLNLTCGIIGILGPNGAGKTTLFRCILGLETYKGQIHCPDTLIGYLPQDFSFFKGLTVRESLEYLSRLKNIRLQDNEQLIEETGLKDFQKKKVGKLSGGMLRRLGICQALLGDPKVLILDEPTVGLDPESRMYIRNLLARISTDKIVLISSHIASDLDYLCDQVLILNKGHVSVFDTKDHLLDALRGKVYEVEVSPEDVGKREYVSLRRDTGHVIARVISEDALSDQCVDPTLEDAFFYYKEGKNV